MKKLVILAVALSAAVMYSCKKGSGDDNAAPVVKDAGIDSMAYNLGLAQSGGLKQYMMMQLGVDTAYLDDFIKGMKEGANASGKAAFFRFPFGRLGDHDHVLCRPAALRHLLSAGITFFLLARRPTTKYPPAFAGGYIWSPAATYSPGPLPAKYHRH